MQARTLNRAASTSGDRGGLTWIVPEITREIRLGVTLPVPSSEVRRRVEIGDLNHSGPLRRPVGAGEAVATAVELEPSRSIPSRFVPIPMAISVAPASACCTV